MKIQKRQIAGMNLVYKFYSFDYFLDAMERLGYESIELLPNAPHFYVPDLSASDMSAIRQKIHDHHLTTICYTPDQCSYPVNISYNSEVGRRRFHSKPGPSNRGLLLLGQRPNAFNFRLRIF